MKQLQIKAVFFISFLMVSVGSRAQGPDARLAQVINKTNKDVLVAAHRGDWRNAPENSVTALLNSIDKGFDIMELDIKMSKDSQLVVMHDNTIDRTTNGKGKVSDFTLAELKDLRLRNGLGRLTSHRVPTFEEMMKIAKGKIIINVDKGNSYLPEVFKILHKTGTLCQSIVNVDDNILYEKLQMENKIPEEAYLMVVVNMKRADALSIIKSFQPRKRSIIQPIFDTDTLSNLNELPRIARQQVIWLNSLWPSLNGGHDDDRAVEENQPEESWDWLLSKKPSIIQTDRPVDLLKYLRKK